MLTQSNIFQNCHDIIYFFRPFLFLFLGFHHSSHLKISHLLNGHHGKHHDWVYRVLVAVVMYFVALQLSFYVRCVKFQFFQFDLTIDICVECKGGLPGSANGQQIVNHGQRQYVHCLFTEKHIFSMFTALFTSLGNNRTFWYQWMP